MSGLICGAVDDVMVTSYIDVARMPLTSHKKKVLYNIVSANTEIKIISCIARATDRYNSFLSSPSL